MRIIDANTGAVVKPGETFRNIDGVHTLMRVREGFFRAEALFLIRAEGDGPRYGSLPRYEWVPLVVRYMHPSFLFQKIGFIPS